MTATQLITGTVAGFALVIDPNNEQDKYEWNEYSDAAQMKAHVSRLRREQVEDYNANLQNRNWNPTETRYFTLYKRDDNDEIEQGDGFDPSGKTDIDQSAYKAVCKCGKTAWLKLRKEANEPPPSGTYTCEDCNGAEKSIHDDDFTNYDRMREREY